jgi:hypothetical protein
MEAICSSETSVDFQRTKRRYIPEDRILHNHRCEKFKSYKVLICLLIWLPCLKLASDMPVLWVVIETKGLKFDSRYLSPLPLVTIFRYLKL